MTRSEIAAAIITTVIVGATLLLVAYMPQVLVVTGRHPVAARIVTDLLPIVPIGTLAIAGIILGIRHRNR